MHIRPLKGESIRKNPAHQFRFFFDKVKHFYQFDKDSLILEKDENGLISGILIYTYSEGAFNDFSGPKHLRFYIKIFKTLFGFYGFNFLKFLVAAKSMLGLGKAASASAQNGDFAKIWVLIVAEEERQKGIATKLLADCILQAKQRGITKIRVTVKKDNTPAIKTYEKTGFQTIGECLESSGNSFIMETKIETEKK